MSSFLGYIVTAIFGTYLAFSNYLTGGIEFVLGIEETVVEPVKTSEAAPQTTVGGIEEIPEKIASSYQYGGSIPDILIKNANFQQASVIESTAIATTGPAAEHYTDAIVNLYCTYQTATRLHTTTGSGFFVSDQGVILTNAHVAQFLLLDGVPGYGETECVIRTGDVAEAAYKVDLLYISPAWIQENADLLRQATPRGTGERDYALLYITETISGAPLPARVPYLSVNTSLLSTKAKDTGVTVGGYPAETSLLNGDGATVLEQAVASSSIADLFTFNTSHADIFYLTGSSVGQHGVSGGPVINDDGEVIGMISTKSDDELLGPGSLSAITTSYIHRTIEEETGFGFAKSIGGNLPRRSAIFKATIVPFLSRILACEL